MADVGLNKKSLENFLNNYSILLIAILFILFRNFNSILNPVFFAEEGKVFFSRAYFYGIKSFGMAYVGYYQFIQCLATYLATLVSLENAPFVTVLISIIVHLIPVIVVVFLPLKFDFSQVEKFIIVALVIVSGDGFQYSTTCSHFVLSLACTFLVFLKNADNLNLKIRLFLMLLIVISSLSCVYTCLLLPFFIFNYFENKDKFYLHVSILISICLAIQFAFFVFSIFDVNNNYGNRFNSSNGIGYFFFRYYSQMFCQNFIGKFENISRIFWITSLVAFIYIQITNGKNLINIQLSAIIVFFSLFGMVFSVGMYGGERYMLIPNLIFVVLLILNKNILNTILVFCFLVFSLSTYSSGDRGTSSNLPIIWKDEVRKWTLDNKYKLKAYPLSIDNEWDIQLKKSIN